MSVQFVNHKGEPIDMVRLETERPKKTTEARSMRVDDPKDATHSYGFLVFGYTPEQQVALHNEYEFAKRMHDKGGKDPGTLEEFERNWMRRNKPKKARTKPYELHSSAQQCADLLKKQGWSRVEIEEQLRRSA